MILKSFCPHCDGEVLSGQPACSRCGAPSSTAVLKAPDIEPDYQLYQNAWRGFATVFPQGWEAAPSDGAGVTFFTPDFSAQLELVLLPAQAMINAAQQAELYLSTLPGHRGEILGDSDDSYVRAVFEGPTWRGVISVHLTPQGGTLAIARSRPDYCGDLEVPFAKMLASLSPLQPIPRQAWREPSEGAFTLELPLGWQCQSRLMPPPTMTGVRQPTARIFAESSGHILLALEPEYRVFVHGELPRQATSDEGFLARIGRLVQNAGHGMAQAMGETVCPFHGLRPAVEHVFWPFWQQTMPGVTMLGYTDHGKPDQAEVRLLLPGEVIRVLKLGGFVLPGTGRWMGGHTSWYQAPAVLMPKFEPVFLGVMQTVESNPVWKQNEVARSQGMFQSQMAHQNQLNHQWSNLSHSLHQQRMNDIAQMGQANTAIHQNRMAMGDMQMGSWQNQSQTFSTMQHHTVNGINERDDFVNPHTGVVHNLSHHVSNYWQAGPDVIVGSNAALQPPPDWTPLQRWDGR